MKCVVDLDQHQAIQDFTVKAPASNYQWKSQDTIDWMIYFVRGGIVQDLGAGMAIKYGCIVTGDATDTILAYQATFSRQVDSDSNAYYLGQVVYNTSQMASAISGKPSINCTSEIRYQTSDNEIIHSLNISSTVYATILVETGVTPPGVSTGYPDASAIELLVNKDVPNGYAGLDAGGDLLASIIPVDTQTIVVNSNGDIASAAIMAITAANFSTPAINATVSVSFVSTSGLRAGEYVRVTGAGYYAITSITDSTHAILTNIGDPLNAASGTTVVSGAVLLPAQAVSGTGGGSTGQNAFTVTTANFIVPDVGSIVSVTVENTDWMGGSGYWVFVTGAGYYAVNSVTDSIHVVLTNGGGASNATVGVTVNAGATVSAAGVQGATGPSGQGLAAYDVTTADFVMPGGGANVTISIGSTAWVGVGQVLYITNAGYMSVVAISSATQLNVSNLNYQGNTSTGITVSSGSHVGPGGLQGAQGPGGSGLNAFTTLSSNFTQPAVNSTVTATVGNSSWAAVGQGIFVQGGGYYTVNTVIDLTHLLLVNLGGPSNTAVGGTVVGNGTQLVTPAGIPGTIGVNAYTVTTANFTAPSVGTSVTVTVGNTAWASNGQIFYVTGAGYYQVAAILSSAQFSLTNLGYAGNAAPSSTIGTGASVSPSGPQGPAGVAGSVGAPGRDGAYATIYTDKSLTGNGGVSTQATLVNDIAQATGAYKVYQRDSSGNSKWDVAVLIASDAISSPSGGEVSHIASNVNGTLALKKLKTGAAGSVVLTDNGATTGDILIDVPVDGTTIQVSGGHLVATGATPKPDSMAGHLETPTVKNYYIDCAANSNYTIIGFYALCGAGTATVSLLQNGTTLSGTSLSVSTTISNAGVLSKSIIQNDKIQLAITAATSCTDLAFSVRIQK